MAPSEGIRFTGRGRGPADALRGMPGGEPRCV